MKSRQSASSKPAIVLILILILVLAALVYFSGNNLTGKVISPQSPEAFPLETNYYSFGSSNLVNLANSLTFDFSVPLTSINCRDLSYPITASFNSIDYQTTYSKSGKGWDMGIGYIYTENGNYYFLTDRLTKIEHIGDSWKITDTSGQKYFYEKTNQKSGSAYRWDLTKVEDSTGNNFLTFEYSTETFVFGGNSMDISYLSRITDPSLGVNIVFSYIPDPNIQDSTLESPKNPLMLSTVTKQNQNNEQMSKYKFNYETLNGNSVLKDIKQIGNSGGELLIYSFTYTDAGITAIDSLDIGSYQITYLDNPSLQRKVVSQVTRNNGMPGAMADVYSTNFSCDNVADVPDINQKICSKTTSAFSDNRGPTVKEFYTELPTLGLVKNTKIYNSTGKLLSTTDNTYQVTPNSSLFIVYLSSSTTDEQGKISQSTVESVDEYGMPLRVRDYGYTDTANDDSYTITTYKHIPEKNIYHLIESTITTDSAENILSRSTSTYDNNGFLIEARDYFDESKFSSSTYAYDSYGNLIQVTDSLGNKFQYNYPSDYNYALLVSSSNDYYTSSQITYDSLFRVSSTSGAIPRLKTYNEFDEFNRIIKKYTPGANGYQYLTEISFDYSIFPSRIRTTAKIDDSKSSISDSFYDKFGNLLQTQSYLSSSTGECIVSTLSYKNSQVVNIYDNFAATCNGNFNQNYAAQPKSTIEYTADPLSRLSRVISKDSKITSYAYDKNTMTATYPDGTKSKFTYDYYENVEKTEIGYQNNPLISTSSYDALGRIISSTGTGSTEFWTYDWLDNELSYRSSEYGETTSEYDSNSQLIRTSDSSGTFLYSYDNLGRIISETLEGESSPKTTYTYGAFNRALLSATTSREGTYSYQYDNFGRKISESYAPSEEAASESPAPAASSINYEYNSIDLPTKITSQDSVTDYTYDSLGRLAKKTLNTDYDTEIEEFTYNANNQIISHKLSNLYLTSMETSYTYDSGGLLTRQETLYSDGTRIIETFAYDSRGRLTGAVYNNGTGTASISYTYDSYGRILSQNNVNGYLETESPGVTSFTYDNQGRPNTISGKTINYDANNRISSVGTTRVSYDNAGRITSIEDAKASTSFTYNQYGEVSSTRLRDKEASKEVSYNYNYAFNGALASTSTDRWSTISNHMGSGTSFGETLHRVTCPSWLCSQTSLFTYWNLDNPRTTAISQVRNLEVGNENGSIKWSSSVDATANQASGNEIEKSLAIQDKFIKVLTSSLHSSFNNQVTITMNNVDCTNYEIYFKEGAQTRDEVLSTNTLCTAASTITCTAPTCTGNNLTFTASKPSSFAARTVCISNWQCQDWSYVTCQSSTSGTRTCEDANHCSKPTPNPYNTVTLCKKYTGQPCWRNGIYLSTCYGIYSTDTTTLSLIGSIKYYAPFGSTLPAKIYNLPRNNQPLYCPNGYKVSGIVKPKASRLSGYTKIFGFTSTAYNNPAIVYTKYTAGQKLNRAVTLKYQSFKTIYHMMQMTGGKITCTRIDRY